MQVESRCRSELQQTIFSEHLSSKSFDRLLTHAKELSLGSQQFLFREGMEDHHVYVLLSGQVDLSMNVPGRGAVRILSLGPGDLIAWSGVLGGGIMTSSALCTKPSRLVAFPCSEIRLLCSENADFGYEFMKLMASALAKRLLATRLQLLDLYSAKS